MSDKRETDERETDKQKPGKGFSWPTPEKMMALAREHDSIKALSQTLGKPSSSVHSALERMGIEEMAKAAIRRNAQKKEAEDKNKRETEERARKSANLAKRVHHDVLSQEGRQEYSKDSEIKFLRKEVKRLQEAVVSQSELVDRVVSASKEPREVPSFKFRKDEGGSKNRDVVLHISDWHYGLGVLPEDTPGGINTVNEEIFHERMDRYVQAVCGTLRDFASSHTLDTLVFAFGGDMVEGWGIYPGQEWHLFADPIVQVVKARKIYEAMIEEIMGVAIEDCGVKDVSALWVNGNHGKPGGRKGGALPNTLNFDWALAELIREDLSDWPFYSFAVEPGGACYFDAKGHTFLMAHGDEIRGWGGLPWYGMTRWDAKTVRMHHTIYDIALIGHHHQIASVPIGHGKIFVNGNAIGPTNLARFVGSGPASQHLFLISEDHGAAWPLEIHLQSKAERVIKPTIHGTGNPPGNPPGNPKGDPVKS